jgi:hypothetical protein
LSDAETLALTPRHRVRYAIIWFSLAGSLLMAFAVWLRGRFPAPS